MRKLLHADFDRIRKMKIFWAGAAVSAGFGLIIAASRYQDVLKWGYSREEAFNVSLFMHFLIMGIVSAVFCSLFTGTEYSDGTIRNKLVTGKSRTAVYLSNYISCTAVGIIHSAAAFVVTGAAGLRLFGKPQAGAGEIAMECVSIVFLCMAYAAVYNFVTMQIGSKSYAAIVNILLAFAFLLAASYLYRMLSEPEMVTEFLQQDLEGQYWMDNGGSIQNSVPNPHYVSGMQRSIYEFLYDFLPGGQNQQIAGLMVRTSEKMLRLCAFSCIWAVLANAAGIVLFRRKNIK